MDYYLLCSLGIVLILLGFAGCVLPVLPGPVIGYAALFLFFSYVGISKLVIAGVVVAVATVLDYLLPAYIAKKTKCSKWGVRCCFIGTLVGLFCGPLGIVLGPFLGAVIGELLSGRKGDEALTGGAGALLGFVCGIGIKLAAVSLCAYWFFSTLPGR